MADLPLLATVTVSSMPGDSSPIFRALVENDGELSVQAVQTLLGAEHPDTARTRMRYLHALGVMEFVNLGQGKAGALRFRPEWDWCASPAFKPILLGELVKNPGVCVQPVTSNLVEHQLEEGREGVVAHTPQKLTSALPQVKRQSAADDDWFADDVA
jgi:hypothetical protein